jgi:hypothetical protein
MHRFQGFRKVGSALQRHSYSLSLESALAELFRLYDQAGGPTESAARAVESWIEQSAAAPHPARGDAGRLPQLLRTRDLHEFIVREPGQESLKLALLEPLLFHRDPADRWAAVRPRLLAALPRLCGGVEGAPRANLELCKRALTDPAHGAGALLVLIALFNFDADPELPPENWAPRFRRGRFPQHDWEPIGSPVAAGAVFDWRPANPLCRWEFLAADLLHDLIRSTESGAARPARLREAGHWDGRKDAAAYTLYCSMERPPGGDAGAGQLSLLPVDPGAFMPEVQRTVHRHLGPEGVRQLALLLGGLARLPAGEIARLDVAELAAAQGPARAGQDLPGASQSLPGASAVEPARTVRERGRKLLQVLALLCEIELQRVEPQGDRAAVRLSRFMTVLGREGQCASAEGGAAVTLDDPLSLRLHVAIDPLFWRPAGGTLGDAYRNLAPAVLAVPAREHPFLLGLAAWLPGAWERTWEQTQGVLQRSTACIFAEAGLWLREAERYRAAEQLKRDLARLQELGVLGQWRLVRGAGRAVLDHEYRLVAPQRTRQRAMPVWSLPAEAPAPRDVRGWA